MKKKAKKIPIAVLISDVHYNMNTRDLANAAMQKAVEEANSLGVRLVICGDLHDTKANLRGECVSDILTKADACSRFPIVLVGNHDKINERSKEHSLEFLRYSVRLVTGFYFDSAKKVAYIAYQSSREEALELINSARAVNAKIIIMHQGITGSNSGEYIQDKSAVTKEDVSGLRIISGHYHTRQTIPLPNGGIWDYVGNPFTLTYGESEDPAKGYQILYDDGSLEFVPTNLRKHVKMTIPAEDIINDIWPPEVDQRDLIWIKITGDADDLLKINKKAVTRWLGTPNFKLEVDHVSASKQSRPPNMTNEQLLDSIIDSVAGLSADRKHRLKSLWRDLL